MGSLDDTSNGLDIEPQLVDLSRRVSPSITKTLSHSLSPTNTFQGTSYFGRSDSGRPKTTRAYSKLLKPFNTEDIKVLLLENVNQTGRDALEAQGYQVIFRKTALSEDELIERIRWVNALISGYCAYGWKTDGFCRDVHVIGIRSKTKLSERVLKEAKNLIVIGCFCIGTNQVDVQYAAEHGIAVFNSPFSNSRSVAELVIAEIISLARQLGDRSNELHKGTWNKVSNGCWEVRGKTLGDLKWPFRLRRVFC